MDVFDRLESQVRSYSRTFPVVFRSASGPFLFDADGARYIDFLCSAGTLGYGHNEPRMKRAILRYLEDDGVTASLDLGTVAKARFLERFERVVLRPRGLDYRVQFTGPTGANAVEAALKLARKVTGRSTVLAFTNSYHGLSSGALSVTADRSYRVGAERGSVTFLPFDGYLGAGVDTMEYVERVLADPASGIDPAAAVIVETIQAEGGVNLASARWLRHLQALCRRLGMLLIVDDIQVGCGRTGTFFSFEEAGLRPDIVTLSKAIGGYGLPMSIVLIDPAVDRWAPGEHTGTFRGNNLAFVAAAEALAYWEDGALAAAVARGGALFAERLRALAVRVPRAEVRGQGLIWALDLGDAALAGAVQQGAFARRLIVERCGARKTVLKFLPPLTCSAEVLTEAADIVEAALGAALAERSGAQLTEA